MSAIHHHLDSPHEDRISPTASPLGGPCASEGASRAGGILQPQLSSSRPSVQETTAHGNTMFDAQSDALSSTLAYVTCMCAHGSLFSFSSSSSISTLFCPIFSLCLPPFTPFGSFCARPLNWQINLPNRLPPCPTHRYWLASCDRLLSFPQ